MNVAISWAKKVQLAKCDISVSFPKSSHIYSTGHIISTGLKPGARRPQAGARLVS